MRQRGAAWELAIAEFSPSRLMASISASWPETPAIAAFALKKLPSIVWFYGSNMFGFNFERSEFQDLDVTFISPAAQEFWVWNEASIKAWSRRHLLPQDQQPKYRVIGPTMCGDRAWIELSAKQARQKFGVSENRSDFFISIFDVPTMTEAVRAAYGAGPSIYPVEMNERLIRDFFRIATSHPRVRLMFKLKRPANDPTREFSEAIKELLGTHQSAIVNDRITLFPADTDPYIPIAMADLAVGLPFTSPVFAAACSGRHGLHYDPLGAIRILPHKGLDEFLISGFDQLEKTIEKILNSDWQMNRERVRSYISTRQNELNFDKEISK
ncbi:MAG: hypothetical protein IT289_10700 [Oligoflexia bacterium]|nr:hypothetical protein [Oligoflexia bacterium]